jgi:hypothetical protein
MISASFLRGKPRRNTGRPTRRQQSIVLRAEEFEPRVVPTLFGNQLFPSDNPWNQRIAAAPVAANSSTLVNSIGATKGLKADFGQNLWEGAYIGIPYNAVSGNQPKVSVVIDAYPDESDILPVPIPANAVMEGDPLPGGQNHSDRHLIIYDVDNNVLYELFNARRPSETADGRWHADAEAYWDLKTNYFRPAGWTSADAAGLPILPGLVRPGEVYDQGVINHAIRFTVPKSMSAYVFPASHHAGSNNPAYPRMGERFRLKQTFDISGFSAANRVILQAMKDYGIIVADNGSGWYISGIPSSRWDNDDLQKLGQVRGTDFEAVDLRPIVHRIHPPSGPRTGGTVVAITGMNFSGGAGLTQVHFGTAPGTRVRIGTDGSIRVTSPPHSPGTVDVRVISPYGTSAVSASSRFTYTDRSATIGALAPKSTLHLSPEPVQPRTADIRPSPLAGTPVEEPLAKKTDAEPGRPRTNGTADVAFMAVLAPPLWDRRSTPLWL